MKKRKNFISRVSIPLTALLVGLLTIGGTLSYLSSVTEARTNIFSIGNVQTELMEPEFKVEETTISKNPYVTNVGSVDCIVRLKVEVSPGEIEVPLADNPSYKDSAGSKAVIADSQEAERLWNLGYRFWLNFNTNASDNPDKAAWVYNTADGYWYYQGVLAPSEDTSELFTEVKWLILENNYFKDIQDFDIYIKKESTFASYIAEDGVEYRAIVGGAYNQEKADIIWAAMEEDGKIF